MKIIELLGSGGKMYSHRVYGPAKGGLILTRYTGSKYAGYAVTHEASGYAAIPDIPSLRAAKWARERLLGLPVDWAVDVHTLMAGVTRNPLIRDMVGVVRRDAWNNETEPDLLSGDNSPNLAQTEVTP